MLEMEDGLNMNSSGKQVSSVNSTNAKSYDDIMTRRLKNRERQRRYRARKRLEADIQKSHVQNQPAVEQEQLHLNGVACVHCKRDWKKDARRAHMRNGQEDILNASAQSTLIITAESQTPFLSSGIRAEGSLGRECDSENPHKLGNSESRKPKLGRRDWKADARNKKSEFVETL